MTLTIKKPFAIICTKAYEFEGIIFEVGHLSYHSFGRPIPDKWRKATKQDLDNYLKPKR